MILKRRFIMGKKKRHMFNPKFISHSRSRLKAEETREPEEAKTTIDLVEKAKEEPEAKKAVLQTPKLKEVPTSKPKTTPKPQNPKTPKI